MVGTRGPWPVQRRYRRWAVLVGLVVAVTAAVPVALDANRPDARAGAESPAPGRWVTGWAAAPVVAHRIGCLSCTIRNVVRLAVGGSAVRVRLDNTLGAAALTVAHTTVAVAAAGSAAPDADTLRPVRFDGRRQVRIGPGGRVWSDPVRLLVPADADVLVSTYVPAARPALTCHRNAHQTSLLAPGGDVAAEFGAVAHTRETQQWCLLTGVAVRTHLADGTLVALGDSITAGTGSTLDANARWTDVLAERIARHGGRLPSVVNAGIAGNQLLVSRYGRSALRRSESDVLNTPGVRTVIVAEGINDLQFHRVAAERARLIAGYRRLVGRLHAHGLRVLGATVTPCGGHRHCGPLVRRNRRAVNAWIRTSGVFDAVVDFDAAVRDPDRPDRLSARYDSGDHLHPSDAGYRAMAAAVDLSTL